MVDQLGDHRAACRRNGPPARRASILERAWGRVAGEAVAAEGRVVPQQWLARTTVPGVAPDDRRRLDLVMYGASRRGEALSCDVTLVSPLQGVRLNRFLTQTSQGESPAQLSSEPETSPTRGPDLEWKNLCLPVLF